MCSGLTSQLANAVSDASVCAQSGVGGLRSIVTAGMLSLDLTRVVVIWEPVRL